MRRARVSEGGLRAPPARQSVERAEGLIGWGRLQRGADKQGYAREEREQRADHRDVAEDQAGQRHPVARLAGLADLTACDVAADDRRDASYEPEEDLPDSAGQRVDGHGVRASIGRRDGPCAGSARMWTTSAA